MVVTEDLGILKWWAISPCVWPDLCNSRIAEIVSDEYSRLELLGLEGIIKFDVLVVEKFAVEQFAIFCVPLGKRCRSVTSYTRFVLINYVGSPNSRYCCYVKVATLSISFAICKVAISFSQPPICLSLQFLNRMISCQRFSEEGPLFLSIL